MLIGDLVNKWSGNDEIKASDVFEWIMSQPLAAAPAQPSPRPVAIVKRLFGGKIITTLSDTFDLEEGTLLYAGAPAAPAPRSES